MTTKQRKIYKAVLQAFPKTKREVAYDYALQGGVKFQFKAN